jgi:hypothetical protein
MKLKMNDLLKIKADEIGVTRRQILNAIRFPRIRKISDGITEVHKTFSEKNIVLSYTQNGDVFKIASICKE